MNRTSEASAPPLPAFVRPPELLALPGGVSLRRRTVADVVPFNAAVVRNLDHLRPFMPWALSAPSLERTREMTELGWKIWEDGTDFMYVAGLDDAPGSVVGAFGLHGRIGPAALEIGYWVDAAFTGRGIATNASAALTAAALELPGIHRVEIHCDEANPASAAVPRKLGYRLDRIQDAEISAPAETGRKLIWIKDAPADAV
ncbi:RimJ/RimL family protein N-acetyltransferase [Kitasatospora sp. MAP12-15]|uniref:GNAT family N-acetyltransferase n=1 Tax=unclassified Kitasatospora TaxID=2633591 RepID=UPI002473CD62|nr:GNAT family N-acetyltransferase [Kitasatospora sp. MAP12-44]MDH6109806.1 RimJ/RimL family protein N-acetyltransferase [Kitasatospora sp. MAP12-44]